MQTTDQGARRYSRPVEKREGIGVVADLFQPSYGTSKDKMPPYLVKFPDGASGWYDSDEVRAIGRASKKLEVPVVLAPGTRGAR